jgi:predicted RNA binding protein YcfA (HicA-like mRNA interferase family)
MAGYEGETSSRCSAPWQIKRSSGSHLTLSRPGWPDFVFSFHGDEELGPRMLSRVARKTGLKPKDL